MVRYEAGRGFRVADSKTALVHVGVSLRDGINAAGGSPSRRFASNAAARLGLKRRFSLDAGRDRVLQLFTCTAPAGPARRFVVTCVLEGERGL